MIHPPSSEMVVHRSYTCRGSTPKAEETKALYTASKGDNVDEGGDEVRTQRRALGRFVGCHSKTQRWLHHNPIYATIPSHLELRHHRPKQVAREATRSARVMAQTRKRGGSKRSRPEGSDAGLLSTRAEMCFSQLRKLLAKLGSRLTAICLVHREGRRGGPTCGIYAVDVRDERIQVSCRGDARE